MSRVLLVKLGAIGDAVMLLPAAWELHQQGHEIEWLCGSQIAPLLELYPWVKTVLVDEVALLRGSPLARSLKMLGLWRRLAGRSYALVATMYYDSRYRLLTRTTRARRRLSLSASDRGRRILPARNHADEYARILLGLKDDVRAASLTPAPPLSMPASPLSRSGSSPRVVLVPGGAKNLVREDALRRWPVGNFVAVARELLQMGCEVILSGGPDDRWASAAFAGTGVTNCIGQHSLVETVGLFHSSDVVITPDSGPLHLAAISGVMVLGVFGPTSPHSFLPQRDGVVGMWGGEGFACRPCYDGKDYAPCSNNLCLQQVTPEMVVREVQRMLREGRSARRIVVPSDEVSR